jgi:hypothetical protein
MAQLLGKWVQILRFGESRSGMIAHKNKKRIMAGTQYFQSWVVGGQLYMYVPADGFSLSQIIVCRLAKIFLSNG